MNVLLLSAGRRTSLAHLLQHALARYNGTLHVADMDGLASTIVQWEHAHPLPPTTHSTYDAALIDLVAKHHVDAVIPCIDADLIALVRLQKQLAAADCRVVVSNARFIEVAVDKLNMAEVFSNAGVSVAPVWVPSHGQMHDTFGASNDEFVVKPRFGAGSGNLLIVRRDQIDAAISIVPDPIVQPRIVGNELTVDALFDLDSQLLHYVPRRRIKTMGGESIQGQTVDNAPFAHWLDRVFQTMAKLGARGPQTVQFFMTDGGPVLGEVNPRFGGGMPLAHRAGGRYADWLIDLLAGVQPAIVEDAYVRGVLMTRTFAESFLDRPRW